MKICRYCKHGFNLWDETWSWLLCCEKTRTIDIIYGRVKHKTCTETRNNPCQCGNEGKWFEQKPKPPKQSKPMEVLPKKGWCGRLFSSMRKSKR